MQQKYVEKERGGGGGGGDDQVLKIHSTLTPSTSRDECNYVCSDTNTMQTVYTIHDKIDDE